MSATGTRPATRARRGFRLLAIAIVIVGAGAAGVLIYRGDAVTADADDADLVARGGQVYADYCAACHGARLEGQPDWRTQLPDGARPAPPHDETGHTWHHPDRQLFDFTKYGGQRFSPPGYRNNMPAFEGTLADGEIWSVLAYIKSTWPAPIRGRHDRLNARAE